MKKTMRFISFFLLSTLLASQSLVDVAKKEQERREKLKGKNARVVTNADLQSVKRTAAVTTTAAPAAGETAGGEEPAVPEVQEAEGEYDRGTGSSYATGVLGDTFLVENPESALYSPDGGYAEISVMGQLDLEFNAQNGPGDDIAIYARWAGAEEAITRFEEEGIPISAWPGGTFSYGVLVMRDDGEWEALGRAMGTNRPEKFDLGSLPDIKRIRIIFKPDNNPSAPNYPLSLGALTMGVDAVEALY